MLVFTVCLFTHSLILTSCYCVCTMIPLTLATVIMMGLGLAIASIHASNQKMPKEAKIKAKYLDKARKHSDRFFAPFIDWHKVSSVNGCGKLSNGSINDVVGICVAR